jgi:serine/threonine protein kinase
MQIINTYKGGFSKVEIIEMDNGAKVARKVFDPDTSLLASFDRSILLSRFRREIKVQINLPGDFFIPIIEYDFQSDPPWFTMPYAEKNFEEEILLTKNTGTVPKDALADILNDIEQLHALGYVHRDLKPRNILFHDNKWKLADFGLISPPAGKSTSVGSTNTGGGTRDYCSPEQQGSIKQATKQSDIYAFGCILHDIYDGNDRIPYSKQTCKGEIGPIIERCTETTLSRRFKNISDLRIALLTIFVTDTSLKSNADMNEWIIELKNITDWDDEKSYNFIRFINEDGFKEFPIFSRFDSGLFEQLFNKNEDISQAIALRYCQWARGGFNFNYCDVLVLNLETIFNMGNYNCKAAAAISTADLGAFNNRWFVMRRLFKMCSPENLDDTLAKRIAIEMIVENKQQEFKRCAEILNKSVNEYHPFISKAIHGQ